MQTYKAVIFDLDGTLLNTLDDIHHSVNEALEILKYPSRSVEQTREAIGNGVLSLIEQSLPQEAAIQEPIVMKMMHHMGEAYSKHWNINSHLYDGIAQVLDKLMFNRVPMGILSNKPHPFTVTSCKFFLKKWDFSFITGGREHIPLKPNPAAAYEALSIFQQENSLIQAEDVLFVGDGDTDMKTAEAAGMDALGVLWGFRSQDQLKKAGAKYFASTPADILTFF
ncbi:MAG: HAD family hydrolase [Brevinema sp.]